MMKFEDQVCSPELSKKLKELGIKQESEFYWIKNNSINHFSLAQSGIFTECDRAHAISTSEHCSAFTVAELGEILKEENHYSFYNHDKWYMYEYAYDPIICRETESNTEADARAKMIIYLKDDSHT